MNSLSWLIYGAETLDKIAAVSGIFGILTTLALIGLTCMVGVVAGCASEGDKAAEGFLPTSWKLWRFIFCLWLMFGVLYVFTPSKNTVYAVAASQVGETLVNNPHVQEIGGDAYKALQMWLKKQAEEK